MSDQTIKAVIFDLDGVILSTDNYHYLAWKKLADELGVPLDRKDNERQRGVSRMESLEVVLEKCTDRTFTNEEKLALAEKKNADYLVYLQQMPPRTLMMRSERPSRSFAAVDTVLPSTNDMPFCLHSRRDANVGVSALFLSVGDFWIFYDYYL